MTSDAAPYGQFCPVAKAAELLDQRWMLLVVRELLSGSTRFNDIQRGVPRMSPSLLSKRLGQLQGAGLLEHDEAAGTYELTPPGLELRPVVEALGTWGVRWMPELGDEDLDPHLLLWDMRRRVDRSALPAGRTVVQLRFADVPSDARDWWMLLEPGEVDVCDDDPGHDVDLRIETRLRVLVRIWRGDTSFDRALRAERMSLHGPEHLRRAFPDWVGLSPFAEVPRG